MRDKLLPFIVGLGGLFGFGALFIAFQFLIRTVRRRRDAKVLALAARGADTARPLLASAETGVGGGLWSTWASVRHGRMRHRRVLENELEEEDEEGDGEGDGEGADAGSLQQRRKRYKKRARKDPMADYAKKRRECEKSSNANSNASTAHHTADVTISVWTAPLKHTVGWGPAKATVQDLERHKEQQRIRRMQQRQGYAIQPSTESSVLILPQPGESFHHSMDMAPSYHSIELAEMWQMVSNMSGVSSPAVPYHQHPAFYADRASRDGEATSRHTTSSATVTPGTESHSRPKLTLVTQLDPRATTPVSRMNGYGNSFYPSASSQHQREHSVASNGATSWNSSTPTTVGMYWTPGAQSPQTPGRPYPTWSFDPPSETLLYSEHPMPRAWDAQQQYQQHHYYPQSQVERHVPMLNRSNNYSTPPAMQQQRSNQISSSPLRHSTEHSYPPRSAVSDRWVEQRSLSRGQNTPRTRPG